MILRGGLGVCGEGGRGVVVGGVVRRGGGLERGGKGDNGIWQGLGGL